MNGLDKITARIEQDSQKEIGELLDAARAEARQIADGFGAQARAEAEKILERGRQDAAQRGERLDSMAQLDCRKATLAVKQELLDEAFDRACEKLRALGEEEYVDLLADLAVKASATGRERLIFSAQDRERVGKAVVLRANEKLAKAVSPKLPETAGSKAGALLSKVVSGASAILNGTGMLTLAEETRPISGGFILSSGDVEVNCTFETLVRLQRSELSGQVAKVLFE